MKGKTMQSVYLLPEDNKDNPVIPASYPITIQNTDGSHRSNSALSPIKSQVIGFYQNYTVPCTGMFMLRVALTQAEEATALYKLGTI